MRLMCLNVLLCMPQHHLHAPTQTFLVSDLYEINKLACLSFLARLGHRVIDFTFSRVERQKEASNYHVYLIVGVLTFNG